MSQTNKYGYTLALVIIFVLSNSIAINVLAKTPDQTPDGLEELCKSIVIERGKFPAGVIERADIRKILTEVSRSNNTNGWGMLSKRDGANCSGVSCDIMFHGPTCYIYDVLGSATGEGNTGGIATPTCDFVEGNMDRGRWVGIGTDTRGTGSCAGVTPPEPTGPPTITSFSPTIAIPGETVEIVGTNLSDKVILTDQADVPLTLAGTIKDSALTNLSFQLNSNAIDGTYTLSVESSKGKATATEKLTIKAGGSSFTGRQLPGIPDGYMGLDQLLAFFLNWSKYILGISIFMMVFYGGVKWFFSQGNPSQIGEAQGIIKNAAIGAILLLSAYLILYTVNPDLVNGTFALPGIKTAPGGLPPPPPGGGNCSNLQALAAQNNEPYPRRNSTVVTQLITDIKSKLPGVNVGRIYTFDETYDYCNYTRGNTQCGPCSHAVNSCHYGGRTGNDGALAIDFTVKGSVGDKVVNAAMASGAKDARCENNRGVRVSCIDTSATHVHVTARGCDAN